MSENLIYVFPTDSFDRDEAHKWVNDDHFKIKLDELINDGRIKVYSVEEFVKASNNRDIYDISSFWFVSKNNIPSTPIQHLDIAKDVVYATGAYISPFSYINKDRKICFAWIVTEFPESVYLDGKEINVVDSSYTLEGLTPPANQEEIEPETIIKTLIGYGLSEMGNELYRKYTDAAYKTLEVRKLNSISEAGAITQILSTLDKFLLDAPEFSQDGREILAETFGRDRTDIFTSEIYPLIIGSCRANTWAIGEYEDSKNNTNQ